MCKGSRPVSAIAMEPGGLLQSCLMPVPPRGPGEWSQTTCQGTLGGLDLGKGEEHGPPSCRATSMQIEAGARGLVQSPGVDGRG
jgi:hypothetical protein